MKNPLKLSFLLLAALLPAFRACAAIIGTPWLQSVTTRSVVVMVECDSRNPVHAGVEGTGAAWSVFEGSRREALRSGKDRWIHRVVIGGLEPFTRYRYVVSQEESSCDTSFFYTAVEPGMPFRMTWLAGTGGDSTALASIGRTMKRSDPMMAIASGWFTRLDESRGEPAFHNISLQDFRRCVPIFFTGDCPLAPGDNISTLTDFRSYLHKEEGWMSFSYGDLFVLSLKNDPGNPIGEAERKFITGELAASNSRWKILILDPACSGVKSDWDHGAVKELLKSLSVTGNIDLILAGNGPELSHAVVEGTHCIGSALQPKEKTTFDGKVPEAAFALLDVAPGKIKVYIYNGNNDILDSFQLRK